ncbi:hypothetical protein N0O92_01340 [Alkalihalobacillus sp. MEB130]|uniref:hypothetical protein n=1 Tax=Alkalihalobacillus sp. MEB130 TaxID=2976704 RepID=UPI0028DE7EA3|nr:hypothetical protein [Alkalihalobacillus sp. MEB130]MDT8858854.1 hypothetical protein [Alkalihalobacillus sp. MEB130]
MKKITLSVATALMLLGGLAGCGADNQATDMGANQHRTGALGIGADRQQPGIGARNDLGGQVDHDGGFFRNQGQGHVPGEVEVGHERPRGFGTDFGQGRAGGFFGVDGDRQRAHGTPRDNGGTYDAGQRNLLTDHDPIAGPNNVQANQVTVQRTLDQIENIDGVREARVSGSVIEIRVAEGTSDAKEGEIERQAQKLAEHQTVRIVNRF